MKYILVKFMDTAQFLSVFNNACHCMYTMLFYLTLETAIIISAAHKVYKMLANIWHDKCTQLI